MSSQYSSRTRLVKYCRTTVCNADLSSNLLPDKFLKGENRTGLDLDHAPNVVRRLTDAFPAAQFFGVTCEDGPSHEEISHTRA